jgi:hypothetical protein
MLGVIRVILPAHRRPRAICILSRSWEGRREWGGWVGGGRERACMRLPMRHQSLGRLLVPYRQALREQIAAPGGYLESLFPKQAHHESAELLLNHLAPLHPEGVGCIGRAKLHVQEHWRVISYVA